MRMGGVARGCVTHDLCCLGGDGSGRETSARGTFAGAFRLGARAYVAELCEQLYQIPQTEVSWSDTIVTRPSDLIMWISWRNLGKRCACSSLRKDLGAWAYAVSGTTDRGEVERHDSDAPQNSHHVDFVEKPWREVRLQQP